MFTTIKMLICKDNTVFVMISRLLIMGLVPGLVSLNLSLGQTTQLYPQTIPTTDKRAFQSPAGGPLGANWHIVGDAKARLDQANVLTPIPGSGVLVNLPDKASLEDGQTTLQHGDIDLDLDFMLPKGGNSGLYLQGRYGLKLADSWVVKNPKDDDNGSVSRRWDESRPDGQQAFDGHAPRQNASRAPGLWQHLSIQFRAPRFDINGPGGAVRKTANARLVRVQLNGVVIHENVDLSGPTRGGIPQEAANGPIVIQGSKSPIALRNLTYKIPTDIPLATPSPDSNATSEEPDLILLEATTNTTLRSFMDVYNPVGSGFKRIVHGISVGSPEQVHYSYDLDKGALFQIWRGGFLDATPMWHDRGDGSSRPLGMVQSLGSPAFLLARLATPETPWPTDTTGSGYRPKGYVMDAEDRPTFRYKLYSSAANDSIRVLPTGQGVSREVTLTNSPAGLYARLAESKRIEVVSPGLYVVGDKAYYINIDPSTGAEPIIRTVGNRQELLVPFQGKLRYSILF